MENVLAHTRVLSVGEQYANDTRDLARVLGVASLHRIEGYDISNIMGRDATGSMVVFVDGEPAKSEYKRFKIKTVTQANDVKMLEEVLTRRLKHSMNYESGIMSHESWPLPDLIIVDGGKAQLNVVLRVVRSIQTTTPGVCLQHPVLSAIFVIAIAKGGHGGVLKQKEEIYPAPFVREQMHAAHMDHGEHAHDKRCGVYFPGQKEPLRLPNASPALHLVLRVRDEAHRFAVGYHKKLRKKKFFV